MSLSSPSIQGPGNPNVRTPLLKTSSPPTDRSYEDAWKTILYALKKFSASSATLIRRRVVDYFTKEIVPKNEGTVADGWQSPPFTIVAGTAGVLTEKLTKRFYYENITGGDLKKLVSAFHTAMASNVLINLPIAIGPAFFIPEIAKSISGVDLSDIETESRLIALIISLTAVSSVCRVFNDPLPSESKTRDMFIRISQELLMIGSSIYARIQNSYLQLILAQLLSTTIGTSISYLNVYQTIRSQEKSLKVLSMERITPVYQRQILNFLQEMERKETQKSLESGVPSAFSSLKNPLYRVLKKLEFSTPSPVGLDLERGSSGESKDAPIESPKANVRLNKDYLVGTEMSALLKSSKEQNEDLFHALETIFNTAESSPIASKDRESLSWSERFDFIKVLLKGMPGSVGDAITRFIFMALLTKRPDSDSAISFYFSLYFVYFTVHSIITSFAQMTSYGANKAVDFDDPKRNHSFAISLSLLLSLVFGVLCLGLKDPLLNFLTTSDSPSDLEGKALTSKYYLLLVACVMSDGPMQVQLEKIKNVKKEYFLAALLDNVPQIAIVLLMFALPNLSANDCVLGLMISWFIGNVVSIAAGARFSNDLPSTTTYALRKFDEADIETLRRTTQSQNNTEFEPLLRKINSSLNQETKLPDDVLISSSASIHSLTFNQHEGENLKKLLTDRQAKSLADKLVLQTPSIFERAGNRLSKGVRSAFSYFRASGQSYTPLQSEEDEISEYLEKPI